jgi:nucleoside-diphosphate-sugar epimerase
MRVFVAGASGAIGEPLIAELLKQGHSVVGMTTMLRLQRWQHSLRSLACTTW